LTADRRFFYTKYLTMSKKNKNNLPRPAAVPEDPALAIDNRFGKLAQ